MHWRRFHFDDIPIDSKAAFDVWLRNRWREKDYMLEYYNRNNRFPAENFWKEHLDMDAQSNGGKSIRSVPRPAVQIETEVKSGNWNEFVKIFAPITSIMMALTVAYGAKPADFLPGGSEFYEQHMKSLLSGGELKGMPSPDELEKLIEHASKMGVQDMQPKDRGKVQQLTQENLAMLVKETAIKSGMVLPGGMRRVNTALPAMTAPPQKGRNVAAKPVAPKAKSAVNMPTSAKKAAAQPKEVPAKAVAAHAKPTPPTEMQEVMLKSGVTIKIPKPQVEEAKKTGTIVTANGLVIKVGKDEIEEAQRKKGSTVMTAAGVPIKITPSGAIAVGSKPAPQQQPQTKAPAKPAKAASTAGPAASSPRGVAKPALSGWKPPPAGQNSTSKAKNANIPAKKSAGPQVVTKKKFPANGAVKKPPTTPAKLPPQKPVVKK
jgi:hypothetical protein